MSPSIRHTPDSSRLVSVRLEVGVFLAIVGLAALLRLPDLGQRGVFDADQGRHLLDLRAFVLDGVVPLLGPATSIGNFHHGALYYYVLAPVAFVSGGDPVAVTAFIALAGVLAVAVTGWLARVIGGPIAGLLAALQMAVASSAVAQSIFIWNPNLIGVASAIALAASWKAWRSRSARWWVVAGGAAVATMQFHVLGVILTPVVAALLVADARRRKPGGGPFGRAIVVRAAIGWLVLGLVSYLPLFIHELQTGGSELSGALGYLTSGGDPAAVALPFRIVVVGVRVLSWPLTGLLTDAPALSGLSSLLVVGLAAWLARGDRGRSAGDGRSEAAVSPRADDTGAAQSRPASTPGPNPTDELPTAARWLGLGLVWTILALAAGSASLAVIVPGLPNDDYHAFADPMIVVLVAVGLAALIRRLRAWKVRRMDALAGAGALLVVAGLFGWNLGHQPPAVSPDGGWLAARSAASRVIAAGGVGPFVLSSLPTFKTDDALRMPLDAAGARLASAGSARQAGDSPTFVILCDQLFRDSIGADCGGPAEDAWLADPRSGLLPAGVSFAFAPTLADRFEAAPGRWISVYRERP